MPTTHVPLAALAPHPLNSNAMPDALFDKLVEHIRATDRYPALIVRALPPDEPRDDPAHTHQLLDGHHRARALTQLQHTHAHCDVWPVDDTEALTLMATLNRLEGRDDPLKRAALLRALAARVTPDRLRALTPDRPEHLDKLLTLRDRADPPRPPRDDAMPVSVHFFLTRNEKRRLDAALAPHPGPPQAQLLAALERPAPRE